MGEAGAGGGGGKVSYADVAGGAGRASLGDGGGDRAPLMHGDVVVKRTVTQRAAALRAALQRLGLKPPPTPPVDDDECVVGPVELML